MPKKNINVVWLKRDLRFSDHQPLSEAIDSGLPILLLYIFEPAMMSLPEFSNRHWRFVYQSLKELNNRLPAESAPEISILYGSSRMIFSVLLEEFEIGSMYTHQGFGLKATYDRDEDIRKLFLSQDIPWIEFSVDGIVRAKKNRQDWEKNRLDYLNSKLIQPNLQELELVALPKHILSRLNKDQLSRNIVENNPNFQNGGELLGRDLLNSFLKNRFRNYSKNISNPELSLESCSRLSAYLAYGCLSVREVYQATEKSLDENHNDNLVEFLRRLFRRSHYMQKLETEWQLEFEPSNPAMAVLDREYDNELFEAWAEGKTGYPFVDATIRCLKATGYANARMRATLVTFATFALWQDWKKVAVYLANLFLDFEPGIHYWQMHLHAGLTGYHILRVFNPSAQSNKHDKDRVFVKRWLPELKNLPDQLIPQPWRMTEKEQVQYNCEIGKDYPNPIVDFEIASTIAKTHYWKSRQREEVFDHLPTIFEKHSLPRDIPAYMHALKLNIEEYRKAKERLR